jgi:hypothetical protein
MQQMNIKNITRYPIGNNLHNIAITNESINKNPSYMCVNPKTPDMCDILREQYIECLNDENRLCVDIRFLLIKFRCKF